MKKIAAFVPARGGSERTPGKNLQHICGVPLFLWAANNLSRCLKREDIYIDSDSDEILGIARSHGFNVIKRPADLATNATDGNRFMLWEVSNVEAEVYVQHLPPMIFLKQETLSSAINAVVNEGYDSAFSAIREHFYIWKDNKPTYDLKNIPNSFTLPLLTIEGMGLYVVKRETILSNRTRVGDHPYLVQMDKYEAIDIDYPEDLEFARSVAKGVGKDSPYTVGIDAYRIKNDVRLFVIDIDGTLTDGGMYYSEGGEELKKFNTKDGLGIKRLASQGVAIAFLSTGKNIGLIERRADHLGVSKVYAGHESKEKILKQWCDELGVTMKEVAYIGDDINDLVLISHVGLFACPSDAIEEIKEASHIVLSKAGGEGCVREFIDKYLR